MRRRKQVDAFTAVPYKGNPVAVVLDADGISDADMSSSRTGRTSARPPSCSHPPIPRPTIASASSPPAPNSPLPVTHHRHVSCVTRGRRFPHQCARDRAGVREDPVTGSLNAALAQWFIADGILAAPYVASQGTALGRRGRVHVSEADGEIWVGGDAVTCIDGQVEV